MGLKPYGSFRVNSKNIGTSPRANSVYVIDVDKDGKKENITCGNANDHRLGQVTIWGYQSTETPPPYTPVTSPLPLVILSFQFAIIIIGILIAIVVIYLFRKMCARKA